MQQSTRQAVVELRAVSKSYRTPDHPPRAVLEGVDFTLREGEIVALLGASGCGKSTMLRLIAGLMQPDEGEVLYRGRPLGGPARGISMVFQSFALFPWLTVQKNVELGLEAQGVAAPERARRAAEAIALIGLSGFEGALPRELSGGMRQRVGIARALVLEPDVLLMDEAFSALDVLTGERLREEILDLWQSGRLPTKAMLVVSHNIEEAVMMADRILVMGANPGRIESELAITLARPRPAEGAEVRALIDRVYSLMTSGRRGGLVTPKEVKVALGDRLPQTDIARIEGVLDELAYTPFHGRADLPRLAEATELGDEEFLEASRALTLLDFAHIEQGDIVITPVGREYAGAAPAQRQALFRRQALEHVPLIAYIRQGLEQDASGDLPRGLFLRLLRYTLGEDDAEAALRAAIEWGRYGNLYEYSAHTGVIHLPEEERAAPA